MAGPFNTVKLDCCSSLTTMANGTASRSGDTQGGEDAMVLLQKIEEKNNQELL